MLEEQKIKYVKQKKKRYVTPDKRSKYSPTKSKAIRDRRRAKGLCTYCGKPVDRDGMLCTECLEKTKIYNAERREILIASGICPICGKNNIFPNEKSCPECKARSANNLAKSLEKRVDYNRSVYEKRKEAGLCPRCGKNKPKEGGKWCEECLAKKRRWYKRKARVDVRAEWKSELCCMRCGKPERVEGKELCPDCYRAALASIKKCAEKRDKDFNKTWRETNMKMRGRFRKLPIE